MVRAMCLLAFVAACGAERTPVTTKLTTLGYARAPAVVIVTMGPPEMVAPWVASMRASTNTRVIAEIAHDGSDASAYCRDAKVAANEEPFDEVVVVKVQQRDEPIFGCDTVACTSRSYQNTKALIETIVTSYRASSCAQLRTTMLPTTTGSSLSRPSGSDPSEEEKEKAKDLAEASEKALELLRRTASVAKWSGFPRDSSIQLVDGKNIVIAGPLKLGEYFLKTPGESKLQPGIRAVSVERNMTRLEVDDALPRPEPGDEIHRVTDMRTVAGYTSIVVGTANAQKDKHGLVGAAVAARWSWDRVPAMFEVQFGGDLVPGIDSRRLSVAVAGGLRLPTRFISPVVFVELGLGTNYQGSDGARAFGGLAGVGAGLELRVSRWYAFADVRLRALAFSDYTDKDDNPLAVEYPDQTWTTRTGQLGVGFNF